MHRSISDTLGGFSALAIANPTPFPTDQLINLGIAVAGAILVRIIDRVADKKPRVGGFLKAFREALKAQKQP